MTITLQPAPPDIRVMRWHQNTLTITLDGGCVNLAVASRADLPRAIHTSVTSLPPTTPFAVLLALAWIALNNRIPTRDAIDPFLSFSRTLANVWGTEVDARYRPTAILSDSITPEMTVLGGLQRFGDVLPATPWTRAWWLVKVGRLLWRIDGIPAAAWGTLPIGAVHQIMERKTMMVVPLLAAWSGMPDDLPFAIAPDAVNTWDAWIDWSSLAYGPGPPPAIMRPRGLGHVTGGLLETNPDPTLTQLSTERAQVLFDTAMHLLAQQQRPAPRYIDQTLQVLMPETVIPELRMWNIHALVIVPNPDGLWCSVTNNNGESMGATWWQADAHTGIRVPLAFPPAAWVVLHAVLAALWADLCADAVTIESPNPRQQTGPRRERGGGRPTPIVLPPPRYHRATPPVPATWITPDEEAILDRTRLMGRSYRRLPAGWEERRDNPDFQRRRTAAQHRAGQEGVAPPPDGWTFVASFTKTMRGSSAGSDASPTSAAPRSVRSTGLTAMVVALNADLDRTTDDS